MRLFRARRTVLCNSGCEDGIAEQAPSSGGNLPSDRHLTRHFYSCSKGCVHSRRSVPVCAHCLYHTRDGGKIQGKNRKFLFFVKLSKNSHNDTAILTTACKRVFAPKKGRQNRRFTSKISNCRKNNTGKRRAVKRAVTAPANAQSARPCGEKGEQRFLAHKGAVFLFLGDIHEAV